MATIINTPGNNNADDGMGALLAVILIIVIAILFIVFALPAIRGNQQPQPAGANINVTLPAGTTSGGNTTTNPPANQ